MMLDNDMDLCKKVRLYVDIDGVLANIDHRLLYMHEKNYDEFYGIAMADDEVDQCGVNAVEALIGGFEREYLNDENTYEDKKAANRVEVVMVTGRPERTRSITELWLTSYVPKLHEKYARMLMRADGDYGPSGPVKYELISKDLKEHTEDDMECYYIDDDPENVRYVCHKLDESGDYIFTGIIHSSKRLKSSEQNN